MAMPAAAERPRYDPPGTTDPKADAAFEAAATLRRQGKLKEAAQAFEQLASDFPHGRRAAQALTTAAEIYQWQLDDPAAAARLFERALAGPSDLPGVMPALTQRLSIERERGGPKAEVSLIDALIRRRAKAEYTPYLLLRASRVLLEDLQDPAHALEPVELLLSSYGSSTWSDDGLFLRAKIRRRLGRPEEALKDYRKIIASEEPSLIVGEYDSDLLDDAYLALADTLRDDLHRAAPAEDAYRNLVDAVPDSVFVDDALWSASQLAKARGDVARAKEDLARLAKLRPASRHLKAQSSGAISP